MIEDNPGVDVGEEVHACVLMHVFQPKPIGMRAGGLPVKGE